MCLKKKNSDGVGVFSISILFCSSLNFTVLSFISHDFLHPTLPPFLVPGPLLARVLSLILQDTIINQNFKIKKKNFFTSFFALLFLSSFLSSVL